MTSAAVSPMVPASTAGGRVQAGAEIAERAARGFERHGFAFGRIAPDGALIERVGAALDWLPAPGGDCFATPVLIGMREEFAALRAGGASIVALPAIAQGDSAKTNVTIVWDESERCYVIAAAQALGANETEAMLVRERRERRLADEQAEAARRRANVSEALYRDIVDAGADLVLRLTSQRRIAFANRRAQTFAGRPLDALVGRAVDDVLPVRDGAPWSQISGEAGDVSFEQQIEGAAGEAVWIWWRAAWLREPGEYQALGRDITRLRELQAEVERAHARARTALVMRERLKIAHDLHDTIVQALVAVVAQLRMVRKLARRAPDQVEAEIERAEQAAKSGLERGRAALGQVRFQRAGLEGLGAALSRAAARLAERTGLPVDVEIEPRAAAVDGEAAEILYRIVEEALRNVETHAQASRVAVSARARRDGVCVTVADDGRGFDPQASNPGHYGLVGMIEQARMIGGRVDVRSRPGAGAQVEIYAPHTALE